MKPDLHIINLRESIADLAACKKRLSQDEIIRMQRFATPQLQQNFALTRGSLRLILGEYLQVDPATLEFTYNEFGKPFLDKVQFNMAHSGDYCVIALAKTGLIGVDIEYIDRKLELIEIAKRFFTPREYLAITQTPEPRTLFFHIWTQKEAFLKATGKGITFGLDQFEVSTDLATACVTDIKDSVYAQLKWQSEVISTTPGYRLVLTFSS